jgi:hypothetical protein
MSVGVGYTESGDDATGAPLSTVLDRPILQISARHK